MLDNYERKILKLQYLLNPYLYHYRAENLENFQKLIKKFSHSMYCILVNFNWIYAKIAIFWHNQGTLVTNVTSKCLVLNFEVKFRNYA